MSIDGFENAHDTKEQQKSSSHTDIRATPVRFKSSKGGSKRRKTSPDGHLSSDSFEEARKGRSRHRHHHRSRRHNKDSHVTGGLPGASADTEGTHGLDPDSAFRESLFDAMADDEGADFWQGVYGQPIHRYPNAKEGPDGELERMNDEEYVAYVRARMWEKSHEGLIEERMRREEAARKRDAAKKESARLRADARQFDKDMEESLRRGERRRAQKNWTAAWEQHEKGWKRFLELTSSKTCKAAEGLKIPWPVKSGKVEDVTHEEVESFMRNAGDKDGKDVATRLKSERVRYHPDKVQQRIGSERMLEEDLRAVTKTFQIIDDLYAQHKA